ncbi:MAG TPA: chemotaxis protein CheX [Terriglobia bacterium]|nr:chemotaxis protein CheX [Terriglobia bacterium]
MRLELIQPFVNATDAVLAEMLQGPVEATAVTMREETYQRKGVAASVAFRGDIVGHVIFDLEPGTASWVARALAGGNLDPSGPTAAETVCELANVIVGNAVTLLNDHGYSFKVSPPAVHSADTGFGGDWRSEALVMCFKTPGGNAYLNVAMEYARQGASQLTEVSS